MTGFGRAKETIGGLDITVEMKSVNHRYFEFTAKTPRGYSFLDDKLKNFCQQKVTRGKVEVLVLIDDRSEDALELAVNESYAAAYVTALRQLAQKYSLEDDIKASSFIGNNDIFSVHRKDTDEEAVTAAVLQVAEEALLAFVAMRQTEGGRLIRDVEARVQTILDRVAFIESRSPQTVQEYRLRIEQRIRELLETAQVDEQRLLTETAIFADKVAVDEETVRLRSHIKQLCTLMETGDAIGRKLDFIVQEMNREANTIGSKAQDIEIGQAVVDIKSEIEKIREQIQNLE